MKLLFLLFISFSTSFLTAQSTYHVHIAGGATLLFTTDLQIEVPINYVTSFGLKLRNHPIATNTNQKSDGYSVISNNDPFLIFFKGNTLDAFGRRYFNVFNTTNSDQWFGQVKFGFGNYQNPLFRHKPDLITKQNYVNQTFTTLGGGIGIGRKSTLLKYFTLELYAGLRFYTPPQFTRAEDFNELNYYGEEEFAQKSWFISRSFPLELNWKIGFQI